MQAIITTRLPPCMPSHGSVLHQLDRDSAADHGETEEDALSNGATEWDRFQALPSEFLDAGDTVVVLGYCKAAYRATGVPLNAQFAHIWRLRDAKITAFQQYTDTAQAARAVHG
jgi:ketosteroid isomerase-like protein